MPEVDIQTGRSSPSTASPVHRPWQFVAGAGLIGLVAFLLRIYRIGASEVWSDEGYSYLLAVSSDWFGLPTLAHNTPPFHHWLLRAWIKLAGDDETGLRLLSAVIGTLFVLALIWAGRELFTPLVGLWSGAFAAVAPLHISHSQETRTYVLLTLMLALTYGLLARAIRRDSVTSWALVASAVALSLYSHHLAVLGLLPTLLLPWALSRENAPIKLWRHYLLAMGLGLTLFAPWALASYLLAQHPLEDPATPWLELTWEALPPSLAIFKSLEMLGLGGHHDISLSVFRQFHQLEFPNWLRFLGLGVLLALAIWGMGPWEDRKVLPSGLGKRKLWLATTLLFPLVAMWIYSFLRQPIYVVGRYDVIAFPAYALLVGLAFAKLKAGCRHGIASVTMAAILLAIPVSAKLILYYANPAPAQFKQRADLVVALAGNDDVVIFNDPTSHAVLYYLNRDGYVWESGVCRHRTLTKREFFCHFFPTEAEVTLRGYASVHLSFEDIRRDAIMFASHLQSDRQTLWLVSQLNGLREIDTVLFAQLEQLGLKPIPRPPHSGVYGFRRPFGTSSEPG